MFVFENLEVYKKSLLLYSKVSEINLGKSYHDKVIANQMLRAALSISLNIAEGSGKESKKDRRNFLVISRGSLYETVSILNVLKSNHTISESKHLELYSLAEEVSKMLRSMISSLTRDISSKSSIS